MFRHYCLLLLFMMASMGAANVKIKEMPVLYVIGDSTVKNGSGNGGGGLWGWGNFLSEHFDTTKISIVNVARGGRSSRTYITEGLWDEVLNRLKPGDYVLMQFGHNDGGPVNDDKRARGSLRGTGEETEEIDNMLTGKHEVVHTYGWYMRKYIADTKAKGATPIVFSLVARNIWKEGKVERSSDSYAKWAAEAASAGDAFYVDLNDIVAANYEKLGQEFVTKNFFLEDHTHTTEAGARLNAASVVENIKKLKGCKLKKYLKHHK